MPNVAKYVPFLLLFVLLLALPAAAQQPDFGPHVYVDGVAWGTKGLSALPVNENNGHSFDILYVFPNLTLDQQLLIGDAAPGDADYNGGRWEVWTVTWNNPADRVPLTSQADIQMYKDKLTITKGSFAGGPPDYFECPLLPVLHD
ncbi:MAG: hypothetical protein R3272_09465 [Candidatus Promineifilaceae bacterium]|nr:hypothetical protein [Candidatus Promineifilaceae bacterium]